MKLLAWALSIAALAISCNTADLLAAVQTSVKDAGTPLPAPTIVPNGGTYFQTSDITGITAGSMTSGYRLFYTSDGTDPAFTPGGTPDWTHTSRNDTGMMGWGSGGPWAPAFGQFTLKAQNLDGSGRRSPVTTANFRVVGYLGVISASIDSGSATAIAMSSAGEVATGTSGPFGLITVRNSADQVLWSRTISGTGTVNVKGMIFSTSGRLWVCGNVVSGGIFSVSGSPVTFTANSAQAGFLVSFDPSGTCLGAVCESSNDLFSSFNGVAVNDSSSFVYLACSIDRSPGGGNYTLQRTTSTGSNGGSTLCPVAPQNAGMNAVGLRLDFSGNYLSCVSNSLLNAGASDTFNCVTYHATGGIVAFGGSAQGPQFEYDGTTPVTAMGNSNKAPLVVATDYAFSSRYTLIGKRPVVATANAQIELLAELPNGHVVAAGTEGPNDGVGWTWYNGGSGLTITPTDTSTAFWISMSAGAAFAVQQISSPSSINLGGLAMIDSTAGLITSYTLGAGTSSGWVGGLAPSGTPSPWIILSDENLSAVGWWKGAGLGPGTAGPLVHAPGSLNQFATLWFPTGSPAMDLGEGLTAPTTSASLLLRSFD